MYGKMSTQSQTAHPSKVHWLTYFIYFDLTMPQLRRLRLHVHKDSAKSENGEDSPQGIGTL